MASNATDDTVALIVDNGSGLIKAGFAGDDAPKSVFPCFVGHPKYEMPVLGLTFDGTFIGDDALKRRGVLFLRYPMEHGIVTNWDDMEKIWLHTFYNELYVAPEDQPILLTEAPLNPKANREKMTEVMFETFYTPAILVRNEAALALHASGRGRGLMVDCGDGVTHVVPVDGSNVVTDAVRTTNLAGRELTRYLTIMLADRGYNFLKTDPEAMRDIKTKLCYCALDIAAESQTAGNDKNPDETYDYMGCETLTIGNERFRCPGALFQPAYIGWDLPGIHQLIYESIMACDISLREDLFANIVLAGGSTMFPGMEDRLKKEMEGLVPKETKVGIVSPPERKYLAWIGGSKLASLSTSGDMWVTKQEYEENGPSIVHRKCV